MPLTERDRAILDFERTWWQMSGPKESAIRELFSFSSTKYYEVLGELIDTADALEYDPLVVRRLRRMRARRRRARYESRSADGPRK